MAYSRFLMVSLSCVLFASVQMSNVRADDTTAEVRPSFLLNVETGGTLGANQFVISAFGVSGARASYGITKDLEARADVSLSTIIASGTGTSFGDGATLKYHVIDLSVLRIAAKAQFFVNGTNLNSATTGLGAIAVDAQLGPVLLTVIPRYSSTSGATSGVFGVDYGVAVPIIPFMDVIGELNWSSVSGSSTIGGVGGVVLKPAKRVTIPIVLVNNSAANSSGAMNAGASTTLGFLAIFAHIGFEL